MPELYDSFKVVDYRDLPSADPARLGKDDRFVLVEFGPGVRSTVSVPAETFSEQTLTAAVKALKQEREKWLNRSFRL